MPFRTFTILSFILLLNCNRSRSGYCTVYGTVVDDLTGLPIRNAEVAICSNSYAFGLSHQKSGFTDNEGRFQFDFWVFVPTYDDPNVWYEYIVWPSDSHYFTYPYHLYERDHYFEGRRFKYSPRAKVDLSTRLVRKSYLKLKLINTLPKDTIQSIYSNEFEYNDLKAENFSNCFMPYLIKDTNLFLEKFPALENNYLELNYTENGVRTQKLAKNLTFLPWDTTEVIIKY